MSDMSDSDIVVIVDLIPNSQFILTVSKKMSNRKRNSFHNRNFCYSFESYDFQ